MALEVKSSRRIALKNAYTGRHFNSTLNLHLCAPLAPPALLTKTPTTLNVISTRIRWILDASTVVKMDGKNKLDVDAAEMCHQGTIKVDRQIIVSASVCITQVLSFLLSFFFKNPKVVFQSK